MQFSSLQPARCATAIAGLFAIPTLCFAANAELRDVLAAWNQRRAEVSTLRVSWTSEVYDQGRPPSPNVLAPTFDDPSYVVRRAFLVDGPNRVRFDTSRRAWNEELQQQEDGYSNETVIDGASLKLYSKGTTSQYPSAFVASHASNTRRANHKIQTMPLRALYYPTDASLGFVDVDRLVLASAPAVVDGHECVGVTQPGPYTITLWVDPEREYIPLRISDTGNGRPIGMIDIDYARDSSNRWIASRWTISSFNSDGSLSYAESATVTDYQINVAFREDAFEVELPKGTWMHNSITNENYIIREDGSRRDVVRGELRNLNSPSRSDDLKQSKFTPNYRELLETEKGDLAPENERASKLRVVLVGLNVAVILGICLAIAWRLRRRTARR